MAGALFGRSVRRNAATVERARAVERAQGVALAVAEASLRRLQVRYAALAESDVVELLDAIAALLRRQGRIHTLLIPFDRYSLLGEIRRQGRIIKETHGDEGTLVRIRLNHPAYQRLMSLYGELFRRAGG